MWFLHELSFWNQSKSTKSLITQHEGSTYVHIDVPVVPVRGEGQPGEKHLPL